METIKQISVVIPIYNVASYLAQCLDSVYKQIDLSTEVILVNDGSTDNSLEICKQYCEKYPDTLLVNKSNGGLSDARNAGTEVATGKYVYYLDSDDWLAPNAIRTLYDFATKNHCEVVQGGFYYAYNDYLMYDNSRTEPQILDSRQAMLELIKNDYVKNFAWGKLYLAEIVKKYKFPFGKYFEDSYWQHYIIHEIKHYGIIPTPLYYYRQRDTGISGNFSVRNLNLLEGNEERLKFIMKEEPDMSSEMAYTLWNLSFSALKTAVAQNDKETELVYQNFWKRINKEYEELFDKALRTDILYGLYRRCPRFIPMYLLFRRFVERIKPSKYKIIKQNVTL